MLFGIVNYGKSELHDVNILDAIENLGEDVIYSGWIGKYSEKQNEKI